MERHGDTVGDGSRLEERREAGGGYPELGKRGLSRGKEVRQGGKWTGEGD